MRLAIVGAGVSGLVVAHLLHRTHDITVFESGAHAGGHAHTVRVDTADETHHVDTGFVVYNQRNYPNFTRLLAELGVATRPSTMTFSVREDAGEFEYSSRLPVGLLARPSHLLRPAFQRMLGDYVRFRGAARRFLRAQGDDDSLAMSDFVAQWRFSRTFVERLLIPLGASIWSADRARFLRFPARYVLAFFDNHGLLSGRDRPQWRTVEGGSARYVEALTRPFRDRVRLSTPVAAITRHDGWVEIRPCGGEPERFDRVVVAAHSDQALGMLTDATPHERSVLEAFPYQVNRAVLHTDATLLPRSRRAWSSWNYHLATDAGAPVGVTYHMNRLQGLEARSEMCVSLNREALIDDSRVVRRIDFAHPLYTTRTLAAQRLHHTVDGVNRTHFCGAYWGAGFHEDGVDSALRVCARIREAQR
ncbi:MAG TPA: FAD-dependent oxidoreductase [Candidatus Dormibacteraeota bacterium]|nr:FAD-dependent oxidoreductase [Candidatus Dormibacteraeota bacterium]